jgi:hypothetical protein
LKATLDRSYTLLPILRKFIGIVLVVMVTLIVLSSMGVNIGSLMDQALKAGAAAAVESVLEKKQDQQPQNQQ